MGIFHFNNLRMMRMGAMLACIFAYAAVSDAQVWKRIGSLPPTSRLHCAYFWDTAHGVVGGAGCIYTYNSGVWAQASYPETPGTINSLRLLDGQNLYAASGSTSVWISSDRGSTWQMTSALLPNADDIYIGADGQIHGMNISGTGMEAGSSFARVNSLSCAAARRNEGYMVYSTDGGISWDSSTTAMPCGYCCVVDSCTGIYYTLTAGPKAVLYESLDGGRTWIEIYDFTNQAVDVLEGANWGVLYVQGTKNVWRNTPGGGWQNIGGPGSTVTDRRMFTFGIYNRYLIEMDSGAVWLWDGSDKYPQLNPITTSVITPSGCSLSTITLGLYFTGLFDSLHIHAYTTDGSAVIPEDTTLVYSQNDDEIKYNIQIPKGQESGTFYFHDSAWSGSECNASAAWDTSFHFELAPKPPAITLLDSVTLLPCNSMEVPLVIEPDVCDTVRIDSVFLQASSGFYSLDRQFPYVVLPGQIDTFWITISDFKPGQYTLSTHINGEAYSALGNFKRTLSTHVSVTDVGIISNISSDNNPKLLTCKSTPLPIYIQTSNCDTIWIDSLSYQGNSGTYSQSLDHPKIVLPGSFDTLWASVDQSIPGIYTGIVRFYGRSFLSGAGIDTSLLISYTVLPDPATPRVIAHNINVSNCRTSIVPIILRALSCDSVEFTSCVLTIDNSLNYSTNLTFSVSLPAGASDTLLITFPPQNLSHTYAMYARIRGIYLGSTVTFDTTVQINVSFTSSAGALIANSDKIALDTVSLCESTDTVATFTNLGCDTIAVESDQTSWQVGWSADDPTFPFSLAPDSSFTVRIHFQPNGPAASYQSMTYGFASQGGKSGTSTQLTMTAVAVPAEASLSISNSALDFGTFSACNAYSDSSITITNTGCDSLALSGASVDAGSGFTLAGGMDTILAPNESARYTIHFADSIIGTLASAFRIHAVGTQDGNTIDSAVQLSATIVGGSKIASISTDAINFGTTSICQERDSSVTITNRGCDTLRIYSGDFSSSQFMFADTMSFPIVIPPTMTARFPIITHLDTTGHPVTITSALNFISDTGFSIPVVALSRSVSYPDKFSLALAAENSAPVKANVPIFVTRNGTVPNLADELDFDLIYNDDVLSYDSTIQPDVKPISQSKLAGGLTERLFAMKPASNRDTIATIQFQSYLSRNDRTTIGLAHQQFIASGAISPTCVATIDTTSVQSNFQLELICGDSTILAAMNDESPFSIVSIQPNPAQDEIVVVLSGETPRLTIEVCNILGQTILTQHSALSTQHLYVSNFQSGIYFLRFSQDGFVQSRQIEIER